MTLKNFQAWMINHDQPDSWWAAIDGEVQDDLMSLPDINRLKSQYPLAEVSVLHVSRSEEKNVNWEVFETSDIKSVDFTKARKDIAKDKSNSTAPFSADEAQKTTDATKSNATDRARQFFQRQLSKGVRSVEVHRSSVLTEADIATNKSFLSLKKEVKELRNELTEIRAIIEELKEPVSEARAMLDEREKFLEMSENSLFEKAQKQEVTQTELAQLADELKFREKCLEEREKAVG